MEHRTLEYSRERTVETTRAVCFKYGIRFEREESDVDNSTRFLIFGKEEVSQEVVLVDIPNKEKSGWVFGPEKLVNEVVQRLSQDPPESLEPKIKREIVS